MALPTASDNVFPKVIGAEQGSDPATPASGQRKLYPKADGWYDIDDTGAVVGPFGAAGSGTNLHPGTSFPGAPATNDLCFRTDRGLLYFYNGTRWLTVQEYEFPIHMQEQLLGSSNATQWAYVLLDNATYDFWCTHIICSTNVITTNNASHYYSVSLTRNPSNTSLGSFTTASDTASTNTRHDQTVGALLGTSDRWIQMTATQSGSPGVLYMFAMAYGRKVG